MRELIYEYVRNIAFYIVFMRVVMLLLPDGKYRGYIRIILGLILVMLMLKPIGMAMNIDEGELTEILEIDSSEEYYTQSEKAEENMNESIKKGFEIRLREDINALIGAEGEVSRLEIEYVAEGKQIKGIDSMKIYTQGGDKERIRELIANYYRMDKAKIYVY